VSRAPGRGDFARISAGFGFVWFLGRRIVPRLPRHHDRPGLVLEGLQQAERSKELGQRAAAVAQQGVEAPGAVAVADQGQGEIAFALPAMLENLRFDPLGALEPPGRTHDPAGQQALQGALGRQFLEQRVLQGGESLRVLVAQHHELLRAQPVPQRVLRRARLAFRRPGTFRPGAVAPAGRRTRRSESHAHGDLPRMLGGCRVTTRTRQHTHG